MFLKELPSSAVAAIFNVAFVLLSFAPSLSHGVPAEGQNIMVAVPHPLAVEAGKKIARLGGNVVDVAIAVDLVLTVTSTFNAGIGGGGFALVKMNNQVDALDFRETAPKAATKTMFKDKDAMASQDGGLAVAIPGIPAGLHALHKKYGKVNWALLFDEAIRIAEKGMEVSGEWSNITNNNKERFNLSGKKVFLKADGKIYKPGDLLVQKNFASMLKEMRNRGPTSFYEGQVARDIVDTVKKAGGILTLDDMRGYKVRWLKPLTTTFDGNTIHLMPPPSSGGVVISSALKLVEMKGIKNKAAGSVDELHLLGEVLNASFRGRSLLGDPDFHQNPIEKLTSTKYLEELASGISEKKTKKWSNLDPEDFKESNDTTHFSVMDSAGNTVAMTITLNGHFGSAVVTDKYGITLNNEIDDFTTKPGEPNMFGLLQGEGNAIQPGKRPLSSMSPTIVEKGGQTVLSVGSPGGPRIISAVFQVLYRTLVTQLNMDEAIQFPRVHHQFVPFQLVIDPRRLTPETVQGLKSKGHEITEGAVAKVYGVRRRTDGILEGAYDHRGEGGAGGF